MIRRCLPYWIVLLVVSCHHPVKEFSLTLQKTTLLDSIPSASGIAILNDSLYIVGDDATGIYKTAVSTGYSRKINLLFADKNIPRIPKPVKHDLECVAIGAVEGVNYLVAFGSGSLSPYRDSLWLMNLNHESEQKKLSLATFYKTFIEKARIQPKDLNIEGATIAGDRLYLFNRGNNLIVEADWQQFIKYVSGTGEMPAFEIHAISLPMVNNIQAGFSGACTLDEHTLVFAASLEDTKDWTKDGEILGSYIGLLDLTPQHPQLQQAILVQKENKPLAIKLESLDVVSKSPNRIAIEAIADNDDGTSASYRFLLSRP
jgi:hypothetical protein